MAEAEIVRISHLQGWASKKGAKKEFAHMPIWCVLDICSSKLTRVGIECVEFILIGCSVLMIINLMIFILEQVDETGCTKKLYSWLCWLIANENRVEKQDQDTDTDYRHWLRTR